MPRLSASARVTLVLAAAAAAATVSACSVDENGLGSIMFLPRDGQAGGDRPGPFDGGDGSAPGDDASGDGMDAGADTTDGGQAGGDAGLDGGGDAGGGCGACGPCQVCTAGTCQVDPNSSWIVVCGGAQLAFAPSGGGTWDRSSGGLGSTPPDPFCEFEMPAGVVTNATAGVTDTVTDSFNATWDQVVSPAGKTIRAADLMSSSKPWVLWIGDDEGNGTGQVACEIRQPMLATWLRAGQFTKQNVGSCVSVTVKLLCQEQ